MSVRHGVAVGDGGARVALDEEVPRPEEEADKVGERVARLVEEPGVGEHVDLDAVAGVEVEDDALRHHRVPVVLVVVLEIFMTENSGETEFPSP